MNDDKNLFFVPILAKAYNNPDNLSALEMAVNEIIRVGQKPEYQKGLEQFQQFVLSGLQNLEIEFEKPEDIRLAIIDNILVSIIMDTFEGPLEIKDAFFNKIKTDKDLAKRYDELQQQFGRKDLEIELFFNDRILDSLPTENKIKYFSQISPGHYSIKFSNGRTIWEGELQEVDLLWKKAFPDMDLAMAAATDEDDKSVTKTIDIFNGEITIIVHAGLESGRISIEMSK